MATAQQPRSEKIRAYMAEYRKQSDGTALFLFNILMILGAIVLFVLFVRWLCLNWPRLLDKVTASDEPFRERVVSLRSSNGPVIGRRQRARERAAADGTPDGTFSLRSSTSCDSDSFTSHDSEMQRDDRVVYAIASLP